MRFVFLSNFTGHPAISVPVGLSTRGKLLHLLVLIQCTECRCQLMLACGVSQPCYNLREYVQAQEGMTDTAPTPFSPWFGATAVVML